MRPVASSRRRHASAQRRDPQSKLGSLCVVGHEGDDHFYTLKMQWTYGDCLATAPGATPEDCLEAVNLLEKVFGRYRRMLGENHPYTKACESQLASARMMARMRSQFG